MFKNASCHGQPTDWWFPEREGKSRAELRRIFANTKKAIKICHDCPCIVECLAYSLENREVGIWGGMGEKHRKEARRLHVIGYTPTQIVEKVLGVARP